MEYLEGYYKETLAQVVNVTDDMSQHLPNSSYAIATSSEYTCVASYQFEGSVNYKLIYQYFAGVEEEAIQPPEIFSLEDNTTLEYLSIRHNGQIYEYFALDYSTSQTAEISTTTELHLNQLYVYFVDQQGLIHYTGDSNISNELNSASLKFLIETNYLRKYAQSFIVSQMTDNRFYLLEWIDLIKPGHQCRDLEAPGGLYSFNNYTVQVSNEIFTWSTSFQAMKLTQILSYFSTLSFGIYEGMNLDDPSGSIRTNARDNTCDYTISGSWVHDDLNLKLELSNKDYSPYKAVASIDNNTQLTMEEIDDLFYSFFFPEAGEMLPTVAPEESQIYGKLKDMVILEPKILLYFHNDVSFEISGNVESEFTVWTGVMAARTSNGIANVAISIESIGSYMEAENVTNTGLTFSKSEITAASDDIDINLEPVMRPAWNQDKTKWNLGVYAHITLTFNEECNQKDFCLIIQNYASNDDTKKSLDLEGSIVGDNMAINYPIDSISIGQGLTLKETALTIEHTAEGQTLEIVGALYIRGDTHTVLRFVGRIYSGEDDNAYLETENESMWTHAFDLEQLNIAGLDYLAQLDGNANILNSNSTALGLIGSNCYTGDNSTFDDCLIGSISINFNGTHYQSNSFNFTTEEVSSLSFFNYLGGYDFTSDSEMPLSISALNFTSLSLFHKYSSRYNQDSFLITGYGHYQGILATLTGYSNSLMHSDFYIQGSLDSFIFGEGNIKMENVTSAMKAVYKDMQFEGYLEGNCSVFGIESYGNVSITDRYLFTIQGYPFRGVFQADLEFTGYPYAYIKEAGFAVTISLDKRACTLLENIIRGNLYTWKDSGVSTLLSSFNREAKMTSDLSAIEALVCEPEIACPTHLVCDKLSSNICISRPLHAICASEKPKCDGVKLTCSSSYQKCVKSECETCPCLSEIEVCEEWTSSCIDEVSDTCREQEIEIDFNSCTETVSECKEERVREPSCEMKCNNYKNLYTAAQEEYSIYQQAYQQDLQDMKGFLEMNELIEYNLELSKLLSLQKIRSERDLNTSGLGPGDFKFVASGVVLDIQYASMKEFDDMFVLNFYYLHETEKTLLQIVKGEIISSSDDMLTQDLATKTPIEVSEENLDYQGEISSPVLVELSSFLIKPGDQVVSSDIQDIMELFYKV